MSEEINVEQFINNNDIKVHELSKQIPRIDDVTLVVIKGHLVIERCLFEILQINMHNHKYLEDAKLSFAQLLNLVKAISKIPPHESTGSSSLLSLASYFMVRGYAARTDRLLRALRKAMTAFCGKLSAFSLQLIYSDLISLQ